jgi:cobalamin biosynthesis protein CobT
MSTSSRVAGAVAAGYVLGRFKKLRLAVIVASAMSSPKVRSAAVGMIQERIPGGAMVGTLTKGVGGKLVDAGKTAATSIVASRIDTLSQSLADRSQNLRKGTPDGQSRKSRADEPGDGRAPEEEAYDEEESDAAEEPEDEYDEEESDAAEEPEDEYDQEESDAAEEPEDEGAQATADDDESPVEEPKEPVARSPRRPRSASPAGRRRS